MAKHTVVISRDLPDVLYDALAEQARRERRNVEDVVVEWLAGQTRPAKAVRLARKRRLGRYIGCYRGNDPRAADNDRIDADLAREYARGLSQGRL
jgi:hypothetical protein